VKNFPYNRNCKAELSLNCETNFRARASRTMICDECVACLRTLKLSAKRYLKMKKEPEYKESVEWTTPEEGTLTYTETKLIKNRKGEVVGHTDFNSVIKIDRTNLEYNINERNRTISNAARLRDEALAKVAATGGKRPVLTSEQAKLLKNMKAISAYNMWDKHAPTIEANQNIIDENTALINIRRKTVMNAPKRSFGDLSNEQLTNVLKSKGMDIGVVNKDNRFAVIKHLTKVQDEEYAEFENGSNKEN